MGQLQAQLRSSVQTALRSLALVCLNFGFDCVKEIRASKTWILDVVSGFDYFSSSGTTTLNSLRLEAFFVPKHVRFILPK